MFTDFSTYRFFIRPGITDLRKAINGLTIIIQNDMNVDPFSKSLFLFCNRQRKLLKVVYWDRNGFCLWQKRVEKETFPWPRSEEQARELSSEQVIMLLEGIDFFKAHKKLSFSRV